MKHWPAEFQPRSLCEWGDSSGGGGFGTGGGDWGSAGSGGFGGGGFDAGGGIGGWGGDSLGGPATGGGDWGSSGTFSAAGMFGYTDAASYAAALAASPGGFYDTGGPGIAPGALGAEFGGTFGLGGISGQPGDPQGAFGSELDAGGGDRSGVGRAIESWGHATPATTAGMVGSYADLSGGLGGPAASFGGYSGGGSYGGRGGGFGDFGTGTGTGGGGRGGGGRESGGRSSVTDSTPGFSGRASGGRDVTPTTPSEAPTRGEAEVSSVSAEDLEAGPDVGPDISTSLGEPSQGDEPTPGPSTAEPSQSQAEPSAAPDRGPEPTQTAPAFGPQSLDQGTPDYQGSPYADMGPQDVNWGSVFEGAAAPQVEPGLTDPTALGVPNFPGSSWADFSKAAGVAQDFISSHPLSNVSTWLSPTNQQTFNEIANLPGTIHSALNPSVPTMLQAPSTMDLQALGEQGRAGQMTDLATQLGAPDIGAPQSIDPGAAQYGTQDFAPGGIDPGAAQYATAPDLATQLGIENVAPVDWGSVFEAPAQDPNWGAVFEGAPSVAPDPTDGYDPAADQAAYDFGGLGQPHGQTDFGGWADTPAADTTMESGQPAVPPSTDTTATPGGDPALSGASVDAANAAANAAKDAGASQQAADAAAAAAAGAAARGGDPAEQANAAGAAARENGATPDQANTIANGVYDAAVAAGQVTKGSVIPEQSTAPITLEAIANAVRGAEPDLPGAAPEPAPSGPAQPGAPQGPQTTPSGITSSIPGGRTTDFQYGSPQAPQAQPGLADMRGQPGTTATIPGGRTTDFNYPPSSTPPVAPPQQPAQPGDDHDDHDDAADPHAPNQNAPAQPGGRLGTPTTGTQNTPVVSRGVVQEQQGSTRNRPVSEALHGILSRAAEQAGVTVHVGSGGQIATRAPGDRGRQGGWTGSTRHNHGNAADIRLESNGRFLNYNNPQDRVIMENFVREAARLGATGMGAGDRYMGPNTIHVGFGNPAFWRADSPGSRALQQAWNEGRHGPRDRPPADIPNVRTAQQAPVPTPRGRPAGIDTGIQPGAEQYAANPLAPTPPQEQPAALPPQEVPLDAPRPPADVPIDIPVQTVPPRAGRADPLILTRTALDIIKQSTAKLTTSAGQAEFNAAGVVAAKGLAAAGVPLDMARNLMTQSAYQGAEKVGYGPSSMGWSLYKSHIDSGIAAALQGYSPAKQGEVQGPPAPADLVAPAPGKRSEAPSGQQFADLSQSTGPAAENYGRGTPALHHLSPMIAPPPPPENPWGRPQPTPPPLYTPTTPGMFSPFRGNEAALPEASQQASLLEMLGNVLSNFNPISTAEAKGRGRDTELQQAIATARQGGNFGGQPGMSVVGKNVFTFYAPGASGPKGMEGPMIGSKNNPLTTLDDVRNGAGFVSLAGHPSQFGQQVFIGNITYTSPVDGKQYTLNNVVGRVDDTGGKFGGRENPDQNHFDIAVGDFSSGWNDKTAGSFVASNYATAVPGRGIGADFAASPDGRAPAVAVQPPPEAPLRGLAKGGRVDDDEPVVVGEQGPEVFVPDRPGTVVPHMPQPGKNKDRNIDRWPRIPAPDYPGRYGGVEREILRQTRAAQNPSPGLMEMIDSERLRLNAANWQRMLNDPALIALGRSRIEDNRKGIDPGAEQYGAFIPASAPAMAPPDPTSQMAQALGYGSIRPRPLRIGRQSY